MLSSYASVSQFKSTSQPPVPEKLRRWVLKNVWSVLLKILFRYDFHLADVLQCFLLRALSYKQLCISTKPAANFPSLCMQASTYQVGENQRELGLQKISGVESWSHNYMASDRVVMSRKAVRQWTRITWTMLENHFCLENHRLTRRTVT